MFKPAKPDYTENSFQKCHEILYIPFTKNSIAYSSAFVNVFYEIFAQKIKKKKKKNKKNIKKKKKEMEA